MTEIKFLEEIFEKFYELVANNSIPILAQDRTVSSSFYTIIKNENLLTINQQQYIVKILDRYKVLALTCGLDYSHQLETLNWKNPVRIIDLSKRIWVEKDSDKTIWIKFKFPYQLKEEFEKELDPKNISIWDHNNRIRSIPLYHAISLMEINEFVQRHNFEIDESFSSVLAQWEEILNQEDTVSPVSKIVNGKVELINATERANQYWQEHSTGRLERDLFLAKSMGYLLTNPNDSILEVIVSRDALFWIKELDRLFDLYKLIDGKVCIVLDRACDSFNWIKQFIAAADENSIDKKEIKICFREKNSNGEFNEWIKTNDLGGPVKDEKILIFENKPPKWLFKDYDHAKIIVTNNIYPPTNILTRNWLRHHYCSIFLGDIRPSQMRDIKIVQL